MNLTDQIIATAFRTTAASAIQDEIREAMIASRDRDLTANPKCRMRPVALPKSPAHNMAETDRQILRALMAYGNLTARMICHHALLNGERINNRLGKLHEMSLIFVAGDERKGCSVWSLTQDGRDLLNGVGRLGRPVNVAFHRDLMDCARRGLSCREAAREAGVTENAVYQAARAHGIVFADGRMRR